MTCQQGGILPASENCRSSRPASGQTLDGRSIAGTRRSGNRSTGRSDRSARNAPDFRRAHEQPRPSCCVNVLRCRRYRRPPGNEARRFSWRPCSRFYRFGAWQSRAGGSLNSGRFSRPQPAAAGLDYALRHRIILSHAQVRRWSQVAVLHHVQGLQLSRDGQFQFSGHLHRAGG